MRSCAHERRAVPRLTLVSQILARRMRLPRAQTHDVVCGRDLRVPMDDGAVLLADRWVARAARAVRSRRCSSARPTGAGGVVGLLFGRLLAERGLQVVIQSVRGTFGSEGDFSPFDERADGLATLRWIRGQPWHAGPIGMIGPSYLGLVQWAVAPDAGDDLGALADPGERLAVPRPDLRGREPVARDGGLMAGDRRRCRSAGSRRWRWPAPCAGSRASVSELPLADLDERATGAEVAWFREALASQERDGRLLGRARLRRRRREGHGAGPARRRLVRHLPALDARGLRGAAGRRPRAAADHRAVDAHRARAARRRAARGPRLAARALLGDDRLVRPAPVRIRRHRRGAGRRLARSADLAPAGHRRAPAVACRRPALLDREPARRAGRRPLPLRPERSDAVARRAGAARARAGRRQPPARGARRRAHLHTAPLPTAARGDRPGPRRAGRGPARRTSTCSRASATSTRRRRVVERVRRADAASRPGASSRRPTATWRVAFELWPIGHRFAAGHRIRLQVSSGAHPRYARNPGTGEDPATATAPRAVDLEVLHDAAHPSALVLPGVP